MANNRFIIEDKEGNKFFPHTYAEVTYMNDGRNLEEVFQDLKENGTVSWEGVTDKPSTFPPSEHTHTKAEITDFPVIPTSLPANGGNADTVDGLHATSFLQNNKQNVITYNSGVTDHASLGYGYSNLELRATAASGTPMLSFHSQGATAVGLYEDGCRLYTTGSDGRKGKRLLDVDDYESLKSSVVNGKTSVANAINGKLGTSLSNQNTFDEFASYIKSIPVTTFGVGANLGTMSTTKQMYTGRLFIFMASGGTNYIRTTETPEVFYAFQKTSTTVYPNSTEVTANSICVIAFKESGAHEMWADKTNSSYPTTILKLL